MFQISASSAEDLIPLQHMLFVFLGLVLTRIYRTLYLSFLFSPYKFDTHAETATALIYRKILLYHLNPFKSSPWMEEYFFL